MLEITHDEEQGTLLEGTSKGDGAGDVVKSLGWRWSGRAGAWFIPRSRDHAPKMHTIERAADALRSAGHEVSVSVDSSHDPVAVDRRIAERSVERAEYLTSRADVQERKAESHYGVVQQISDAIPAGQPILVGHHSEARARRDIARMDANMRASIEHSDNAQQLRAAASSAAATPGARHNPVTVGNRIERLSAEERRLVRRLEGVDNAVLQEHLERIRADLDYWRGVQAEQFAGGVAVEYGPDTVHPGDEVLISGIWRRVVRVNKKSVSVDSGYSWTDRAPWHKVQKHRANVEPVTID